MTRAGALASLSITDRILLIGSSLFVGTTGVMAALTSGTSVSLPAQSLCWSQRLLGRECPGCGLTRSFIATALGDLNRAFELNPIGPLLLAILIVIIVTRVAKWRGVRWPQAADTALAIVTALILLARTAWFYLGT